MHVEPYFVDLENIQVKVQALDDKRWFTPNNTMMRISEEGSHSDEEIEDKFKTI